MIAWFWSKIEGKTEKKWGENEQVYQPEIKANQYLMEQQWFSFLEVINIFVWVSFCLTKFCSVRKYEKSEIETEFLNLIEVILIISRSKVKG